MIMNPVLVSRNIKDNDLRRLTGDDTNSDLPGRQRFLRGGMLGDVCQLPGEEHRYLHTIL